MWHDFRHDAEKELVHDVAVRAWMQLRIRAVHARVTAHDVLRRFGVRLRHNESDHEEQFSCPFHGQDRKPSARVYPSDGQRPSHVWCFVCQEHWDAITLYRKFTDDAMPFNQVLAAMERDYGIAVPEAPRVPTDHVDTAIIPEAHQRLLDACEARLRAEKAAFEPRVHLAIGVLLDRVRFQMQTIPLHESERMLRSILDKIGEKVRCLGG